MSVSAESLRARTLLRSVHSTFSSSHILASSLESFPFAKNRKILHSEPSVKHPPLQYETPPCECDCSPILTLPVDVGCVALYEFWERENSLEKRVRCRKARNVSVSAESLRARTLPHTRPLPFFAFPHLTFFSREFSLSQKS